MADILKAWLSERLGVIMDLTPEMFGHHTRDGTLLAQILHSYDIITYDQMSTILRTQDPALCRVNLKILRTWLKLINVTLSNECIDKISEDKAATALQLFYKVYLSLEGKDRLHFIALRKEREKFVPASDRFEVSKISEDPFPYHPPEHPLSQPLIEATDTIFWYRDKFWKIIESCRRERQRFEDTMYPIVQPVEHFVSEILPDEKQKESESLDEFARKHPPRVAKKKHLVECCPGKRILDVSSVKDSALATGYVDFLKKRSERAIESQEWKLQTQTTMMTEAWKKLVKEQDELFDEALGRRVLDQSRYEKQMMRKLCEIRDVRNRIVENRRIVDEMLLNARESELRTEEEYDREVKEAEIQDVETENRRMRELRQRLREEKARRLKEQHRRICEEIAKDLADIALKAADCRRANDNRIPPSIWSEWRALFLKNQPIFELVEDSEIEDAEETGGIRNGRTEMTPKREINEGKTKRDNLENKEEIEEERRELIRLALERKGALADADFEDYRDLAAPWNEFLPKREEETDEIPELGRVVLGYIVHRLLGILHPGAIKATVCPVPRVRVAAVVLGVSSLESREQLRELLKNSGVRLLTMEDAINHCLAMYKREMADVEYIDLNIVSATARDTKRPEAKSKMDDAKGAKRLERTKVTAFRQSAAEEKQTQTPRQIPFDDIDPILSDVAYIGKWTYEFLTLGQPISNELNTKILIEYIKGMGEGEGWALINFPNTHEQTAMLEKALTGRDVLSDRKVVDSDDINVEIIDSPPPRIVFGSDEVDTLATCGQSRLLPNPIIKSKRPHSFSTTFMTIYVKMIPKPKILDNGDSLCVPLPDVATSIDEFYSDQNIAYGFYYSVLDLSTMKELTELITGHRSIERKASSNISEEESQTHYKKQESSVDPKTRSLIKRWIPKSEWEKLRREGKEDVEIENRDVQPKAQLASPRPRPGEEDWQWLDLPQSSILLESLAVLWENVEEAYIANLTGILSLKRVHTSAVIPYKNLILKNLTKFVDRPDKRQELLDDFHRAFNEIDDDLREDAVMKCELHCRVDDFRAELWELCDARRREAEAERIRVLQNQWILVEAVTLVNVYVGILQTEIDRFVDTMQLLRDYYISMSQKPPQESRFSKILLDCIELEKDLPEIEKYREVIDGLIGESKVESTGSTARAGKVDRFRREIENLLSDTSKSFDPDQNAVYDVIGDNVRQVREIVNSISSTVAETLKREEQATVPKDEAKRKITESARSDSTFVEKLAKRAGDLVEEWRCAVSFEIDRIRRRLDVLDAAARSDVTFLLDTARRAFHRLHDYIVERYKREIGSIDEMANVFRFAVEEAKPIQQELLLDGDEFVVRSNVLMFPEDSEKFAVGEAPSPLRFRMIQLARLLDIFRRIVPRGIVSERALVYILQDLVTCGEEDCYPPSVPCAWRQLRPPDIRTLIEQLFGCAEFIEWREFIVYAMDLPVPSHEDILKARAVFRTRDPDSNEVITRDQFRSSPLWFLERVGEMSPDVERAVREYFQDFDELLDKEESRYNDCDGVTTLNKEPRLNARADAHSSSLKSGLIEEEDYDSRAVLRLRLAKELLSRVYQVNRRRVHYTAMLLAFCKDEDPREGLGKAFTLAMGARVCTDTVQGERYVEKLVEEKRRAKEMKKSPDYIRAEANEAAQEIMNDIINRTAVDIVGRGSRDLDLVPKHQIMMQKLNEFEETDPSDFSFVEENVSVISNEFEHERSSVSVSSVTPEDHEGIQRDEKVIFWLPRDVCLTVLSTCLPWHASQADLFQTNMSLSEGITLVYDELETDELTEEKDVVLAHRLVNHNFIRELFSVSNKFISKDMSSLLRDILKNKDDDVRYIYRNS